MQRWQEREKLYFTESFAAEVIELFRKYSGSIEPDDIAADFKQMRDGLFTLSQVAATIKTLFELRNDAIHLREEKKKTDAAARTSSTGGAQSSIFETDKPMIVHANPMREATPLYVPPKRMGTSDDKSSVDAKGYFIHNWVNKFLQKIHFKTPAGAEFGLDDNGEVPALYDVLTWDITPNGTVSSVQVGIFNSSAPSGRQLSVNESSLIWYFTGSPIGQIPRSVCSESCLPGYRKAPIEGKPICCFYCVPCAEGEFSNRTDMEHCSTCPEGQWPTDRKDGCIQKAIVYLSYGDFLGAVLASVSVVLSMSTVGVLGVFLRYRDTPIVKAKNKDLSYVLLLSLLLAFLTSLLFIGRPARLTCLIQQAAFGIIFTVAVSCVLVKTITVVIAFNAIKPGSRLSRWLGSQVSAAMVLVCTLGAVVICLTWLLTYPPHRATDTQSEIGKVILQCDNGSVIAFYGMLAYMGLLAFASFTVAFLARNLPDRFNEAKLITFSMLVFCSVWVSFLPAYLSTKGRYMVAVEIFAILASSAGLLGCIFIPKCYIILVRAGGHSFSYLANVHCNELPLDLLPYEV
ncbi:vomeronasal type-2 receptor 26-like [Lissotriton helveticus]